MTAIPVYIRNYRTEIPGRLNEDKSAWVFPQINSINAHGKVTSWVVNVRLFVEKDGAIDFIQIDDEYFNNARMDSRIHGWIKVDSGIQNMKVKKSEPTVINVGKNIGKVSETNVFCQALRDALGLYNKQLQKSTMASTARYPPMLSQILKDQKTPLNFTDKIFVQRKYNGVRAVMTHDHIAYSRRKLLYPGFDYIKTELAAALDSYWGAGRQLYLDGEIYKHGVSLQDISGAARKKDEAGVKYNFMIYDCFIANEPNLKYIERREILNNIFKNYKFEYSQNVETFEVFNMDDIIKLYKQFINEGYEGAMIRINSTYQYSYNDYHSKMLLKMKETYDAEMEIVNWTIGDRGKAAGALMIICRTAQGHEFPCTPAMELGDRMALARKMAVIENNGKTHFENHWLGKKITIYYDELSKDKVPQRARTKLELRDDL